MHSYGQYRTFDTLWQFVLMSWTTNKSNLGVKYIIIFPKNENCFM